jgi:hypothetical protein
MPSPQFTVCQHGLGDNVYARPFVRAATTRTAVYLSTPWPELFEDLPVQFVRPPQTPLRTQGKNVDRQQAARWVKPPRVPQTRITYGAAAFRQGLNIPQAIARHVPLGTAPWVFDLPDMGPPPVTSERPIALVHPATLRGEWFNSARNPKPEYIAQVAADLMATHHVVAVADLEEGKEWLEGELPPHHQAFLRGELAVRPLLALLGAADVVVGGVGWIVPAAIVMRRNAFVILGGQGEHNSPAAITDDRMDLSNIYFAHPSGGSDSNLI